MTPEEISNLYIRISFQYESALDQLVVKGLIDKDLANSSKRLFIAHWIKKNCEPLKRLEVIPKLYGAT